MHNNDNPIDITREIKKRERAVRREQMLNKVKEFWDENKTTIISVVPIVTGLLGLGIKTFGKRWNLRLEKYNKERFVYDTSLGHYWKLNRKLRNSEWLEIERRRAKGERLADILASMRVLQ